ncbi:hypothetical protein B0919_14670 [Hymenobacter sp. CRA2]|nr:hypothetical protein B0919_14670 [Hymenobacter sp. CRA2]
MASAGGAQPYAERVKHYYTTIPGFNETVKEMFDEWEEEGKSQIEILEHEIELLLKQVEEKRNEIVKIQKEIGTFQPENITLLIDRFIEAKHKAKPKNTDAKAKNSFAAGTENTYLHLKNTLAKFQVDISIRAFDKNTMEEFEAFLVKERFYNSTIKVLMDKLGAVLNHFKEEYGLSNDYKKYSFNLPLKDESVIYLTTEELKAFRNVNTHHLNGLTRRAQERVKDLALLMSETALRFVDSQIARADIQGGYIIKTQKKTGGKVYIPFTDRLKSILEKYDYNLKPGAINAFKGTFRRLLKSLDMPSLNEEITVWNYIGHEQVPDTRPKYEHCGAHTLRRTMINQCLIRNLRYDKITRITGHKDFDTFQRYADRATKAAEMDSVFDFLNEEPALKVVA